MAAAFCIWTPSREADDFWANSCTLEQAAEPLCACTECIAAAERGDEFQIPFDTTDYRAARSLAIAWLDANKHALPRSNSSDFDACAAALERHFRRNHLHLYRRLGRDSGVWGSFVVEWSM